MVRAILFTAALYLLPLIGAPAFLADPRLWFVAGMYLILDLAQPDLRTAADRAKSDPDQNSIVVVMVAAAFCHVAPLVEWAYVGGSRALPQTAGLGAAMLVSGAALRIWAIVTLGRFFSARVELQPGHELVRIGPYRRLRHPSYTGALMFILGVPLFLQTHVTFLLCALILTAAYAYRIPTEERALRGHFGEAFEDYQRATKRLIPGVW